jgi:hypothetical protein
MYVRVEGTRNGLAWVLRGVRGIAHPALGSAILLLLLLLLPSTCLPCVRVHLGPQVNNNCATGSTAMYMAKQFVEGGLSECVLALGTLVPWVLAQPCVWKPVA